MTVFRHTAAPTKSHMVRKNANALNPNYAVAKFAEDARRRVLRRTLVLQAPDNKADSVKSATPGGFKYRKTYQKLASPFKYNRPISKIKFPFSVFEVHNSG